MPMRRGRGRPKGSGVQKKVKEITDRGLDIHNNLSNVSEVDTGFEKVHEAVIGMPKKRGRGQLIGSSVQNTVKMITNSEDKFADKSSNVLEVDPGFKEVDDTDIVMPKKGQRGRPKGSSLQKKVKQITNGGLDIPDNPSNVLEVIPGLEEVHEAGYTTFSASSVIEVNLSELYSPLPSELRNVLIPFLASNPAMLLSTHPSHRGPAYMVLGEFLIFVGNHSLRALANDQRGNFLNLLNALSDFSFDAAWLEKVKGQIVSPSEDSPLRAFSLISAAKDCVRVEVEQLSTDAARLSKALEENECALRKCLVKAKALEEEESSLLSNLNAPLKF